MPDTPHSDRQQAEGALDAFAAWLLSVARRRRERQQADREQEQSKRNGAAAIMDK